MVTVHFLSLSQPVPEPAEGPVTVRSDPRAFGASASSATEDRFPEPAEGAGDRALRPAGLRGFGKLSHRGGYESFLTGIHDVNRA